MEQPADRPARQRPRPLGVLVDADHGGHREAHGGGIASRRGCRRLGPRADVAGEVVGRDQDAEPDAVAGRGGKLDHPWPGRRHHDRDAAGRAAHEAGLHVVDRSPDLVAVRRVPGQQRRDDREVVAHLGHRLRRVEAEDPLVDVAVAGADPEGEATAGQLVDVEGGERRGLRRPGVGVGDVRAEPDRRRRRGDRGQRHEDVVHGLDAVDGVDAGGLGALGQRHAIGDRRARAEVQGDRRHDVILPDADGGRRARRSGDDHVLLGDVTVDDAIAPQ